ncbi:MAG: hypothetical protein PHI68_00300 [Candidatus Cloacimonetes bacterium]|nr:hypothetical protein [Candidatus Cloacimonadota bacterium]
MHEVLDKLQLVHFFLISYLISRVFVKHKLPERILYYLVETKHISISKLSWILISGTALLSMLIANVITLLTLLPLLLLIQNEYHGTEKEKRKFSTLMLLSLIWGANIGGMGMLTGTTTNGILVYMFELFKYPNRHLFSFFSWLGWGIPLVGLMCLLGWGVLMLVFQPNQRLSALQIKRHLDSTSVPIRLQKIGMNLAFAFFLSAALLSFGMSKIKAQQELIYILTSLWSLMFLYLMFIHKWKSEVRGNNKESLISDRDILHDLPMKGLVWIGLGILMTVILVWIKFPRLVSGWTLTWVQAKYSILLLYLIIALITTFTTEVVSNSVIQISLFVVLFPLSKTNPEISWQTMLIITLCSTCAFMTPLATPSNGLGFGASSKIYLRYMLLAGGIMNLVSAGLITLWVSFAVPAVLRWFG